MPKMKTHSGAKKRIKKTGSGKLVHEKNQQAAFTRSQIKQAEARLNRYRRIVCQ